MVESSSLTEAYAYCLRITREHYENFPVASLAMPKKLRPHTAAVYAFARYADDLADEGERTPAERQQLLEEWRGQLHAALDGTAEHPVFIALADTIRRHAIPPALFDDLIDAFVQDTITPEYETYEQVLDYCSRSANPVGRIVLSLHGILDERTAPLSDKLCTGLQLVNFWQDVSVDRLKPRVYLPKEDLQRFGVEISDVLSGKDSDRLRACIAFQVERTKDFFRDSVLLFDQLPMRLRLELRAVWRGGFRILEKIEKQEYTTVRTRPVLSSSDYVVMALYALLKGPIHV